MRDDWRLRIRVTETDYAARLLERLGVNLGSDAQALASELEGHRLAVSHDEDDVFVYAESRDQAERARRIVESELAEEEIDARIEGPERWLADEQRWETDTAATDAEQDALARGFAPWEVRVERETHAEADELADQLEREGHDVVRRWRYLIVGAASEQEARELARRLHGEVEPGGELVWEVVPQNPFAVFGGLGGTGTPL